MIKKVSAARKRLSEIRKLVKESDHEVAHERETKLHTDVLRAIAAGEAEDPQGLATIALRTEELNIKHW